MSKLFVFPARAGVNRVGRLGLLGAAGSSPRVRG